MSIFNGFWTGEINDLCRLSIMSYISNGHKYRLWSYDNINITDVEVLDASKIVERRIFDKWNKLEDKHKWQTFANYFRFKLIYEHGGWWADLDSVALKHHDFENEYVFSSIEAPTRDCLKDIIKDEYGNIPNGCFKAPKFAPFLKDIISVLDNDGFNDAKCPKFAKWGVVIFTRSIYNHNLLQYKTNKPIFAPFSPNIADKLFTDCLDIPNWAYSVHFYNWLTKDKHNNNGVYLKLWNKYFN